MSAITELKGLELTLSFRSDEFGSASTTGGGRAGGGTSTSRSTSTSDVVFPLSNGVS